VCGVGRKTAERIVVELKDKLADLPAQAPMQPGQPRPHGADPDARITDAAAALAALGIKPADALESARASAAMLGPDATVERLVRASLKRPA
jgi:Holliday junction DNA helicase RuvA